MSFFQIVGGHRLSGSIEVHGAKNSVLPILAACVLARGECVIENCPRLSDVEAAADILRELGCTLHRRGSDLAVDPGGVRQGYIPRSLMSRMRSSVIFLGPLLARTGRVRMSYPGGCELGPRPIDLHLMALKCLGAKVYEGDGQVFCTAPNGLRPGRIRLPFPSVGATQNALLAACGAPGTSVITGAAREPEIVELARFVNAMGGRVRGAGTGTVTVEGGARLHGAVHRVTGDRIVGATYLSAAAAAGGEIEVTGLEPEQLTAVLAVLARAGCTLGVGRDRVALRRTQPLGGVQQLIRTAPYPGFPTDAQAVVMAALATGEGTGRFEETIFQNRYRHVDQLTRMGANIRLEGRQALVQGGPLHAAWVECTDLRGGAALVVAALAARGVTRVDGIHHIDRGYEQLELGLARLGAQIERKDDRRRAHGCTTEQAQTLQKTRTLRLPL